MFRTQTWIPKFNQRPNDPQMKAKQIEKKKKSVHFCNLCFQHIVCDPGQIRLEISL